MNELAFVQLPLIPVAGKPASQVSTLTAAGVCLFCGIQLPPPIHPGGMTRKFCGNKCRFDFYSITRMKLRQGKHCKTCGVLITPKQKGPIARCCSSSCEWKFLKSIGRRQRQRKNLPICLCRKCGVNFVSKRSDAKYCSQKCRASWAYFKREKAIRRKAADLRLIKPCISCKKPFTAKHPNEKTCSKRCSLDWKFLNKFGTQRIRKQTKCLNCGVELPDSKRCDSMFCSRVCLSRINNKIARGRKTITQKIRDSLSHRMRSAIKNAGGRKHKTTKELLGADSDIARQWIESQFTGCMTWDNWGSIKGGAVKWHIDHIIPCSSFNLIDLAEQKKCFHWTNLQPLWGLDNIQKRDRLDWKPSRS